MSDLAAAFLEGGVPGTGQRIPLSVVCRIGRVDGNDFVIPDETVSRHHAILQRADTGIYFILDLGSSNGTFVNGARVTTPIPLHEGDRIALGCREFQFHQPDLVYAPADPDPAQNAPASTQVMIVQRPISVLVADIRNFTGLAQRLDPGTLSLMVGAFFRDSGSLLRERGAWGQNYIGDAVMAVWVHGSSPGPGDIINVLGVACGLARIAASLQPKFGLSDPIRIGTGINSGLASLGNIGSVGHADHTALGETVNRAFRLESMTREIKADLAIGESTYRIIEAVPGLAPVFRPCTLTLKGYTDPVSAFSTFFSELEASLGMAH